MKNVMQIIERRRKLKQGLLNVGFDRYALLANIGTQLSSFLFVNKYAFAATCGPSKILFMVTNSVRATFDVYRFGPICRMPLVSH